MIMNAENDRYHIPPQKAAEGAGQKDETRLALALHRRLSPAAASSRSYSAAVSSFSSRATRLRCRRRGFTRQHARPQKRRKALREAMAVFTLPGAYRRVSCSLSAAVSSLVISRPAANAANAAASCRYFSAVWFFYYSARRLFYNTEMSRLF